MRPGSRAEGGDERRPSQPLGGAEGKRLDESDLLRGVEARHELGQKVLHAAERRAQGRRERRRRGDVPVLGDVVELCVASVADLVAAADKEYRHAVVAGPLQHRPDFVPACRAA